MTLFTLISTERIQFALIEEIEGNQTQMIKLLGESVAEREDFCPAHFKLANYYFKRNELSAALKTSKSLKAFATRMQRHFITRKKFCNG